MWIARGICSEGALESLQSMVNPCAFHAVRARGAMRGEIAGVSHGDRPLVIIEQGLANITYIFIYIYIYTYIYIYIYMYVYTHV